MTNPDEVILKTTRAGFAKLMRAQRNELRGVDGCARQMIDRGEMIVVNPIKRICINCKGYGAIRGATLDDEYHCEVCDGSGYVTEE